MRRNISVYGINVSDWPVVHSPHSSVTVIVEIKLTGDTRILHPLALQEFWPLYSITIIGIQPLGRSGQRPEFIQATGMALVRCIPGKFLGVACHCFPPLFRCSNFLPPGASTSATTWEIPAAEVGTVGENVVRNDDFHAIEGSFTCRKSTTWDRRLYFPSERRRA